MPDTTITFTTEPCPDCQCPVLVAPSDVSGCETDCGRHVLVRSMSACNRSPAHKPPPRPAAPLDAAGDIVF